MRTERHRERESAKQLNKQRLRAVLQQVAVRIQDKHHVRNVAFSAPHMGAPSKPSTEPSR